MVRPRRTLAALSLLILTTPGTFLRSEVTWAPPASIIQTALPLKRDTGTPGWELAGVWQLQGEGLLFGGFSALVALPGERLMSFSDRGARFVFDEPGSGGNHRSVSMQKLAPERSGQVRDIEAAAYDPATGTYWLAFEAHHSIDRFDADYTPGGSRDMNAVAKGQGWSGNSGAEAFTRLADGRFAILPENERAGLIFPGDPLASNEFQTFRYIPPVEGYSATDWVQLPDGQMLLLLRGVDVAGGIPPFASKIALGPAPQADMHWAPQITLDLTGVVPRENYEGIAVRPMSDGRVAVWLIADDNLSLIQRTLVVKLVLDPAKLKLASGKAKGAQN
jgi:hypothetical protein